MSEPDATLQPENPEEAYNLLRAILNGTSDGIGRASFIDIRRFVEAIIYPWRRRQTVSALLCLLGVSQYALTAFSLTPTIMNNVHSFMGA